jgi:GT2 family glycosyltransferase
MALIDVVVVNYNSGPWLRKVVEALHAQTFRDFRAIIVDNGSTDGSLERLPSGQASIEVVRAGVNLGFAAGNNVAIRQHARGEWLALLNPDAFPRPDWLERFIAAARAHPQYNFFGCRMLDAKDPARLDGVGDVYHASGLPWREGHGCLDSSAYDAPEEIFSPCAAAALYRRSDVVEAGLFDEDFFCYTEDVDLGFRLRLLGGRCLYVPDAIVEHIGSGVSGVRSDFQLYHGHRNLAWTYVKNMPGWLFWLYLPYHVLLNAYSVLAFALRGQGRVLWRAKRDAVKGLRRAWRKRGDIQARRRSRPAELMRAMRLGLVKKSCRAFKGK